MTTAVRRTPGSVVALGVSALLLAGAAAVCLLETGDSSLPAKLWWSLQVAPVVGVGMLLAHHRWDHPVARRLLMTGNALSVTTLAEGLLHRAASSPDWVVGLLQVLQLGGLTYAFVCVAALLAVFPTGRPDSRGARWLLAVSTPSAALATAVIAVSRDSWEFVEIAVFRPLPDRFPLHVEALSGLRPWGTALFNAPSVLITAGMVVLFLRLRRTPAAQQRGIRAVWRTSLLATAASFALVGLSSSGVLSEETAAAIPCMFLIPLGTGIAALRDDAFDLDLLLRRSILYVGASAVITAAVAGTAALLGLTAGSRLPIGAAIALAVGATLALAPVRRRWERAAGRWAFGQRVGGYDVMSQVGQALETAYDLGELAPRLAAMVHQGLGVSGARVLVALDPALPQVLECLGSAGDVSSPAARSLPLVHAGLEVGRLECGERVDGVLTPEDDVVLGDLARQAALALHNARLAAELAGRLTEIRAQAVELAASRARLVTAQEVERRRLERDLHDGAQQEIVALMAKLRLARNRLGRGDQSGLDDLLDEVQGDARGLLDQLRELAHGIRPPVLADRGLVGAVESRATRLPLDVAIDADATVRGARYADDVEGAAWFAISELCANSLKHSGAERLVISLRESDGELLLVVSDDGSGIPEQHAASGLRGLRDRIEALGGQLTAEAGPGGGTAVRVRLPARRRTSVDA